MLDHLVKPYDLRGGPRTEQPKVNATPHGLKQFYLSGCEIMEWNVNPV